MPLLLTMRVPRDGVDDALEALVQQNLRLMRLATEMGHEVPRLYSAGVVYREEPAGEDHWAKYTEVLQQGWGDCEDLTGWRVAELRFFGDDPGARGTAIPGSQPTVLHAVVERGDGTIEDPSALLKPDPGANMPALNWDVQPIPGGGWRGIITLQLAGADSLMMGSLDPGEARARSRDLRRASAVAAEGKTAAEALGLAAELAAAVATDPVLMALLPPGAAVALTAAKEIAAGVEAGDVGPALARYGGPAMRRLASALSSVF